MKDIFYSVGGPTRTAKIAVFFDNLTRFRQNRAVDSKRGICVCPKPIQVCAMIDIIMNALLAIAAIAVVPLVALVGSAPLYCLNGQSKFIKWRRRK